MKSTLKEMQKDYIKRYHSLTLGYEYLDRLMQEKYHKEYKNRVNKLFALIELCGKLIQRNNY